MAMLHGRLLHSDLSDCMFFSQLVVVPRFRRSGASGPLGPRIKKLTSDEDLTVPVEGVGTSGASGLNTSHRRR
eukprot:9320715-Pyramimonas_sp.AAC.1